MLLLLPMGACSAPRAAGPIGEFRLVGDAPDRRVRDAALHEAGAVTAGPAAYHGDSEQRTGELLLASGACALYRAAADEPEPIVPILETALAAPELPDHIDASNERVIVEPAWLEAPLTDRPHRHRPAGAETPAARRVHAALLLGQGAGHARRVSHVLTCDIGAGGRQQIADALMGRVFALGLRPLGCGHDRCIVTDRTSMRRDGSASMHELLIEITASSPADARIARAERRHVDRGQKPLWTGQRGVQRRGLDVGLLREAAMGPLAGR